MKKRPISEAWKKHLTELYGLRPRIVEAAGSGELPALMADFPRDMKIPASVWLAAGDDGKTCLHTAAGRGRTSEMISLAREGIAPPAEAFAARDISGENIWHIGGRQNSLPKVFQLAGAAGVTPSTDALLAPSASGHSPVFWAAFNDQIPVIAKAGVRFSGEELTRQPARKSPAPMAGGSPLGMMLRNNVAHLAAPLLADDSRVPWEKAKTAAFEAGQKEGAHALYGRRGEPFRALADLGAFRKAEELDGYMKDMPGSVRSAFKQDKALMKTYAGVRARLRRQDAATTPAPRRPRGDSR